MFAVVESIMRGEDVGITPRRSRSSTAPMLPLVPQNVVSITVYFLVWTRVDLYVSHSDQKLL